MRSPSRHVLGLLVLSACVACASRTPVTSPPVEPPPAAPAASEPPPPAGPPPARVEEAVDTQFGLTLADPYRWMEQPASEELTAWMRAQGQYTARSLARIQGRDALHARIRELGEGTTLVTQVFPVAGRTFYFKLEAGDLARKLMVREADGSERVLLAPSAGGDGAGHVSIDNFRPSFDGRYVAVNLAERGGELTRLRVMETDSGRMLPDVIERVWGEFNAEWLPDGSGFFYSQMDAGRFNDPSQDKLQGMRAYLHRLGRPVSEDVALLGHDVGGVPFELPEFPIIIPTPGSRWVIGQGTGARPDIHVLVARLDDLVQGRARWTRLAAYEDEVEDVAVHGEDIFLLTRKGALNRRVLRVPAAKPVLASARVVVPEDQEVVLLEVATGADALYVREMRDGQARMRRLAYDARAVAAELPLPVEGWIASLQADPRVPGVTLPIEGWTRPSRYYTYDPGKRAFQDTGLASTSSADFSRIAVERVEVPSADGERVPLTLLHRQGLALDGTHPALIIGYGGYGYSLSPTFRPMFLAWLERGGVLAFAHVRGGGEKGPRWYLAGKGANKPKGIQDFIACAQHLTARGYTSAGRLAATGTSMGGVLVGRAMTERPDLFRSVALNVAALNTTRFHLGVNGANQRAELGTPDTPEGLRALVAMDAYLHVKPGVGYPAVIFNVGLNDGRVAPWHSAKMAARLQASTVSGRPVLLRVEEEAGHGVGSTQHQQYAQFADTWAFFLAQAGEAGFGTSP